MVRELIDLNAFGNPQGPFVVNLNLSRHLTRKIKEEFEMNAEWALPALIAMK